LVTLIYIKKCWNFSNRFQYDTNIAAPIEKLKIERERGDVRLNEQKLLLNN